MGKRVLCILAPGFEEIELIAPVDLLRRAGVEVVMASLAPGASTKGRCGVSVTGDAALDEVAEQAFDLLLIPGGPGVKGIRADRRAAVLARRYVEAGKPVAAICAAPAVLHDAGLLAGRKFTAHDSMAAELPAADIRAKVVEDGLIITSRGAGTAVDFGLALVRRLCGEQAAAEVARAIMI